MSNNEKIDIKELQKKWNNLRKKTELKSEIKKIQGLKNDVN